jgi:low affinity Fe/Cu permease
VSNRSARWRRGLFHAIRGRTAGGRSWGSILLHRLGEASAHSSAGLIAAAAVLAWACVGATVGFAAWWENLLYVVSSTVTLVMLFAIQHTQARQQSATQRKLDEILRALPRADGRFIAVEEAPDDELEALANRGRGDRAQALVGDEPDRPVSATRP